MNKNQIAKVNMYDATKSVLGKNTTIINGFARLKKASDAFTAKVEEINVLNSSINTSSKGLSNTKSQVETDMVEAVIQCARGAYVWAKDTGNKSLETLFDIRKGDLLNKSDIECEVKTRLLLAEMDKNKVILADYGITRVKLDAAKALNDQFKSKQGTVQASIKTNKGVRLQMEQLFNAADEELKIIEDLIISGLLKSEPAFAAAFESVFVINDAAVRRTGLQVIIHDEESMKPITNAKAIIEGTNKADESDPDGICEFYKLSEGSYQLKVNAIGRKEENINVVVNRGKIAQVNVFMQQG